MSLLHSKIYIVDVNKRLGKVKDDCSLRLLKVYRQVKRAQTKNGFDTTRDLCRIRMESRF